MSAERPQRRKITARETAERFGVSPRTVRRIVAEPRPEYERRAAERGDQILAWREEGVLWREIGERLGITTQAAQKAGERALKRRTSHQ